MKMESDIINIYFEYFEFSEELLSFA